MVGVGLGGTVAKYLASDTPFPGACLRRTVRIAGPESWRGRILVFVSDVHYGNSFGQKDAEALGELVRREQPDVVLMGGDLAENPGTDLADFLSEWRPDCPTLFAPGNHDVEAGAMCSPCIEQARAWGMHVLSNSREAWDGITFVGLPSALRERQHLELLRTPGFKIVLAHEPDRWDVYREPDLLQLAGHTHGGQICLLGRPLILPAMGQKYTSGTFMRAPNSTLIVSVGVGYTGIPVRINCPPEIVRVEMI
jgi:uncharacterized protein